MIATIAQASRSAKPDELTLSGLQEPGAPTREVAGQLTAGLQNVYAALAARRDAAQLLAKKAA